MEVLNGFTATKGGGGRRRVIEGHFSCISIFFFFLSLVQYNKHLEVHQHFFSICQCLSVSVSVSGRGSCVSAVFLPEASRSIVIDI